MKIFLNISKMSLDKNNYSKAIDKYIKDLHLEGLRAFVDSANVRVPVYTGQARATFVPLAKIVGSQITINPRAARANRSVATGIAKGIFTLVGEKLKYKLNLDLSDPSLHYFQFLDRNPGRSPSSIPSGWGAFEAGRQAYKKTVKEGLKLKPKIKDFFVFTRVTING